MPIIRPSSDLRNSYNEISSICHKTNKPIYITKNGAGDLAVMSIELYESLTEKYENYIKLESNIQTGVQPRGEEIKEVENNYTNKEVGAENVEAKPIREEDEDMNMDNSYTNKDKKPIKNNHINRQINDNKTENNHKNSQKPNSTENVFRKIDTDIKPIKRVEPESAHEILQEIEIEPIMQPTAREKTPSTKEVFRNLDTEPKKVEKNGAHVAKSIINNGETNVKNTKVKDINNTDWIFEDLNKMLNDIKV